MTMENCRNPRPYSDVNWETAEQIQGTTHVHCDTKERLDLLLKQGLGFATLSNYYPSAPYWPAAKIRKNTFRVEQKGFVENGVWKNETLNFRERIARWRDELADDLMEKLPSEPGEPLFGPLPDGFLEAPNAEHHWFSDTTVYLHVCSPGADFTSGHFDNQYKYKLEKHGITLGLKLPWREGFRRILDHLIVPDGGGITINHPHWSHLPQSFMEELLDFDSRVLGIEVFNYNSSVDFSDNSETEWDALLGTGRQCFGFFVQDHLMADHLWKGRNVLLVPEHTAEACLRAYRKGNFYGAITGSGPRFRKIGFDGRTLEAETDRDMDLQIVSAQGVLLDAFGKTIRFTLTEGTEHLHKFLRLTARCRNPEEKLYSQPFMLV